jgi:hypothetical protein
MPADYFSFFSTIAEASATLVGLLFVALSVDVGFENEERRAKQFALSETAFISLGGIFIIALFGLLPDGINFSAVMGVVLALVGIADLVRIQRLAAHVHYPRDLWYIFITIALYVCLAICCLWILFGTLTSGLLDLLCALLILLAGVSLARAWRALLITKRKPS